MKYLIFPIIFFVLIACESNSGSGSNPGKAGSMARFAISGDYLYTVSEEDLTTYDISNPGRPLKLSKQFVRGWAETIFAKDSLLFFGTRNGMLIYDNSNPDNPQFISEYSHIYSCDPVVVHKNVAFVTLNSASSNCGRNTNRLDIVDISDPYKPRALDQHNMESPLGLGIYNDVLFVCDKGLKAFKLNDFHNLELISKFETDAYDVITDKGYVFLIGSEGFHQFKYAGNSLVKVSSIFVGN